MPAWPDSISRIILAGRCPCRAFRAHRIPPERRPACGCRTGGSQAGVMARRFPSAHRKYAQCPARRAAVERGMRAVRMGA
jgi:hypothetical protein